jgi:uncharacterized protein YqcC (DUF446 family)
MSLAAQLAALRKRASDEDRCAWAGSFEASSGIARQIWAALEKQGGNTQFSGWVAAWVEAWLGHNKKAKQAHVMEQVLERDIHLRNIVCGMPVLDVSRQGFFPAVTVAMMRADMTLVLRVDDPAEASWLETTLGELKVDNVVVAREGLGDFRFEEVICRDERSIFDILRRSRNCVNQGGRRYLARRKDEGMQPDGQLVQTISMGPKCHVMHFTGIPEQPGVSPLLKTASLLLDKIEAEMKLKGMWSDAPADLLDKFDRGELRDYRDVAIFEQWLQVVFLARAREAVELDEFPRQSQVSDMLRAQHDPHASLPVAGRLLDYLQAFDLLVQQRHEPGLRLTGVQAVSEGGRLLTKGRWSEPGWFSVDATPYDTDYFPKAMAMLAWGLGMEVQGTDPWEFVLDGVRVAVKMDHRGSCSIAAESMTVRDKIFNGLVKAGC